MEIRKSKLQLKQIFLATLLATSVIGAQAQTPGVGGGIYGFNSTGTGDVVRATSPTISNPTVTGTLTAAAITGTTGTFSGNVTLGTDVVLQVGANTSGSTSSLGIFSRGDNTTTLGGASSQIALRNYDTTTNNYTKISFNGVDSGAVLRNAGLIGSKISARASGNITANLEFAVPNGAAPTTQLEIAPDGSLRFGGQTNNGISYISPGLLAIGTGAAGSTAGSLLLTNLTASGTVTGGGATPFTSTASGSSVVGSITNSLNTGVARWQAVNDVGNPIQMSMLGSTAAAIGSLITGSGFLISNGTALGVGTGANTPITFFTGTGTLEQVRILNTASASRYLTLTGSNGGNPTIGVSAGNLAISSALDVSGASTITASANANWGLQVTNNGSTNAHGAYVNVGASSTGILFRVDKNAVEQFSINNAGLAAFAAGLTVTGAIAATTTLATGGYTVAGLPAAGTAGRRAHVTNQLTTCPVIGAALTGGGAVVCPVFDNGVAWVGG